MRLYRNIFLSIFMTAFLFFGRAFAENSVDTAIKLSSLTNQHATFNDQNNRTVILHGLNEMNKQPPYSPDSIGFDLKSIHFIKSYGFNVVRLGVYWNAIEPKPGFYDKNYLLRIEQTIDLLSQNGIYTLIDFHQDGYSAKYESGLGAPVWAALSLPDKGINPGFPLNLLGGNYGISLATDQDFESFWQSRADPSGRFLQQSYNDMIKMVCRFFLYTPGIIGYEIMNEPFPGVTWSLCYNSDEQFRIGCNQFDTTVLSPFYASVILSIRSVDKKRIIFYEPNVFFGFGAPTFVIAPKDTNLGFSFHNYYNDNPEQAFDYAVQHVTASASVPLMTEFGAAVTNTDQFNQIVELADQYQMSWIEWAYTNNPLYKFARAPGVPNDQREQGIVYDATLPLKGNNVKWDRLFVLSRVYPQIVAGHIRKYQFIAKTKLFTLTFDVKNAMGNRISSNPYSQIFIPEFIYPNGYKIQIQGASIVALSDKRYLILKNDNRSDTVNVMLSPH